MTTAMILKVGLCDCQVCVPQDWTEEQAEAFANTQHPTGIRSRWKVRDPSNGDARRVTCGDDNTKVHYLMSC